MPRSLPPPRVPAMARLARRLYLDGLPVAEIAHRTGLKVSKLYYWIDRVVAADGTVAFSPAPRRTVGPQAQLQVPPKSERDMLLARLWRAAERQLDEIEDRIARAGAEDASDAARPDAEKDARALAVLARTLRELSTLDDAAQRPRKLKAADDAVRDLDTFRRELARRLDRLRADGEGATPAGGPAGG